MPVGFSSPARNLFLLGSTGAQVVSNFFESISKASTTDGVFIPDEIKYIDSNQKYALAGSAADSNSKGFGWLERQDYDLETGSLTTDYSNRIESTLPNTNLTLRAMELDSNENLIVVGFSGTTPWIAKYSNDGVLDWQSTSNSANVRYLGVTSDSNNNYYACGRTSYLLPDTQAFVEKFDSNGNPGWGKSAFMLGRDVVLAKISANDRGEVVAVGFLEDDSAQKGYIVKIDTNTGEVLWDRTLERNISGYGGFTMPSSGDDITPADVKCTACYIDSNDQIYVVGSIDGKGTNDNGVGEFLIKYSPEGNIVWQRERNTRDYINAPSGAPNTVPFDVKSDGETEQTVVLSVDSFATVSSIELSKYSKSGDLVFRRRINKSGDQLGAASLDADPSFYYFIFRDQEVDGLAGEPDRYTFGKVSTSGNGLGNFQYDDGTATIVDYNVSSDTENKIGRMSDGSVTNSVSDLMTYPFTANQVVFDDLATHVSNKKRQMDDADSFEYSGSPAIRIADFQQELNLLGDVYSGSGDWLDQSGKGNNAQTTITTTTSAEEPFSGAGSVEFDGNGDYLSVAATDEFTFGTDDFTIETFIYHKNLGANGNVIIDFRDAPGNPDAGALWKTSGGEFGWYVNGSNRVTGTTVAANQWYHVALVRNSGTTSLYVDGTSVGSFSDSFDYATKSGRAHIGFLADGTGTLYLDGFISNFRIIKGTAVYTSNFTPPTSSLSNTGQTSTTTNFPDYYTGSEWSPGGINAPEDAFTASTAGSGGNGGNFGPFTYTFANPVTGVTSARIRGALGATSSQVGGTTNVILVDGQDVTQKFKNAGLYTTVGWVDVTAEVGSTWNTFRVFGQSGSTNPNVSGVEVNGVQLISLASITTTTGTMLLTAQGASITDTSDSNLSITVNGNTAAAVGGTTTNTVAYNSSGGYFDFDGVDDYISLGTQDFITTQHSVEMWVNISAAKEHYLFSFGYQDDLSAVMYAQTSTQELTVTWRVGGANQSPITTGEILSTNQWYHIVWTRDGATNKIYLDGVEVGSSTTQTTASLPACIYDIGWATTRDKASAFTQGKIGDVRIYQRALTAAQAFQNYNSTKSKYINEAPDTAPKIGPGIVHGSDLLLNYDFGNRATYDTAQNLVPYSENFDLWNTAYRTTISLNAATSPSGQLNAAKFNVTTDTGYHARSLTSITGGTYTVSIFAKAGEYDGIQITGTNTNEDHACFNLVDGTAYHSGTNVTNIRIENYGNGWYRCSARLPLGNGSLFVAITDGTTTSWLPSFAGSSATDGIYIWGAQIEDHNSPRMYIPTYGTAITAPTTVKNLSSSSYTGTIIGSVFDSAGYFDFDGANDTIALGSTPIISSGSFTYEAWGWVDAFTVNDECSLISYEGTNLSTLLLSAGSNFDGGVGHRFVVRKDNSNEISIRGNIAANGFNEWHHYVGVYDETTQTAVAYVDGVQVNTGTNTNVSGWTAGTTSRQDLGVSAGGVRHLDGRIGETRIYNRALTATEVSQNYNATRSKYGV